MAEYQDFQKPLWRITSSERRFILFIGDSLMAAAAMVIALYFWAQGDQWLDFTLEFLRERPPDWFFFLPIIWLLLLIELYDTRRAGRRTDTLRGIGIAVAISAFIYFFIFFISEPKSLPRRGVAAFIAAAAFLTLIWRLLYIQVFTAPAFLRRVLIIGAGHGGSEIAEMIQRLSPPPFSVIGYIDDDPGKGGKKISGLPVLGNSSEMLRIIKKQHVTDLIFSISGDMKPELNAAILAAEESGIEVTTMPVIYEELFGRVPINLLADDWLLRTFVDRSHASGSYELLKRLMDIFGAVIGLVLLFIFFPLIALLIIVDDGLPILFRQTRVGTNGKRFVLLKFRSMHRDAEKDGIARFAVENDERATTVGRFLRKSHLDELPQFINVIRGDISLVGPRAERPELVEKLQKEIPFYRARLFVRPGVTGWAQINYQYASNIEETAIKLEHDLYYIMHRNIMLDIMIIIRTLGAIVGLHGI